MKTTTTCENPLCKNPNCTCDPCICTAKKCCIEGSNSSNIMNASESSWYSWGAALRIAIAVGLIIAAFVAGVSMGSRDWDRGGDYRRGGMMDGAMGGKKDKMAEYCKTMPEMLGCAKYTTPMTHMMDMSDPMSMSMADMSKMMAGKTGDALDRAFLEGMIPHHQGAVDMARMMAGSKHPELVRFAGEIIAGQSREIDQMNAWMKAWGYVSTGATSTGMMMSGTHMMPDGTMMMGM